MDPKKARCRTWSPYSVAGWLPAAPETIQGHLLEMMATGEAVLPVPGTEYHILWRKEPSVSQPRGLVFQCFFSIFPRFCCVLHGFFMVCHGFPWVFRCFRLFSSSCGSLCWTPR